MRLRTLAVLAGTVTAPLSLSLLLQSPVTAAEGAPAPLSLVSGRVVVDGTSNVHAYSASTTTLKVARLQLAGIPAAELLDYVVEPGNLAGFDVVIPAASLTSPRDGVDKNMHKALKAGQHPDIEFRLRELAARNTAATGATPLGATGTLMIAGVERSITLDLVARRVGSTLTVTGATDLLMTDFGINPPRAMLGMLKTDPKVTIRFELVLRAAAPDVE